VGFAESYVTSTELISVRNSASINRAPFGQTFLNLTERCTAEVLPRFRSISHFENLGESCTVYLKMEARSSFETSGYAKLYAVGLCRKLQSMLLSAFCDRVTNVSRDMPHARSRVPLAADISGSPGSFPGWSVCDLWWAEWHWDGLFSQHFEFFPPCHYNSSSLTYSFFTEAM
jgi:hypothetical protein